MYLIVYKQMPRNININQQDCKVIEIKCIKYT